MPRRPPTSTLFPYTTLFRSAVEWDLPAGESYQTSTVSEPTVNLTFEFGSSRRANTDGPGVWVTGPVTERRFDVGIFGRGGVFGVNFHLGGTLAFAVLAPSGIGNSKISRDLVRTQV